ncbi:MAG: hypothetical protein C0603_02280 [Denitrovibrio sp.]|nr:MAG: hypothetical protein C0603_02280 [Denitrovibrio sp.]
MKRFYLTFILFILANTVAFAHELTITDMFGRVVQTPTETKRVSVIGPGALRLLVYAGAQDLLVSRELFEEKIDKSIRPYTYALPDNYMELPVVSDGGPGKMPNIEKLMLAKPDVIFATGFTATQMDMITEKTHIPVVGVSYGVIGHADLKEVKNSIRLVGYITHKQARAQNIANNMAMMRKDLLARTQGEMPKLVYMASIAYKGARGFNSTERNHPSCSLLNLNNIADDKSSSNMRSTHIILQMETILKKQPEYIFYDITGFNILKNDYPKTYKLLSLLNAVKEGNVYSVMPYNWYNSNIENIFLTAYFMGKVLYPDKFSDVDIAHKADDIYNIFLDIHPYKKMVEKKNIYRRVIFEKSGFRFK